jgi:hypothetical protein
MKTYSLIPFDKSSAPDISIEVAAQLENQKLCLQYTLIGDVTEIDWPVFDKVQLAEGLWQTTCLECFLLLEDGKRYIELNFSPKGSWHIYYFDDYRKASVNLDKLVSIENIKVNQENDTYQLTSTISLGDISMRSMGFTAVIETKQQQLSYWALQHDEQQPDFHLPSAWAVTVK